eukprot:3882494-Pleurochrysis_carterae.AAC.2
MEMGFDAEKCRWRTPFPREPSSDSPPFLARAPHSCLARCVAAWAEAAFDCSVKFSLAVDDVHATFTPFLMGASQRPRVEPSLLVARAGRLCARLGVSGTGRCRGWQEDWPRDAAFLDIGVTTGGEGEWGVAKAPWAEPNMTP